MRVPLSWLSEFVELAPATTAEQVHAALVSVGFEEEAVHDFGISGPVVVGQVLEFTEEPQSNGKTIRWCQVRVAPEGHTAADGGGDVRGIVCGAHNFVAGDKVVVTLPGAVLPGPFPIAARKTYGHVSDGMIASARELGLGEDHDGILRLVTVGLDPEVGADALALLGLDDVAVEINVTPDRGYAFSIRGVAREYSHATGATYRDPASAVAVPERSEHPHGFSVTIRDEAPLRGRIGARTFVTRVVRGVDATRPTPPWMVARLTLAGVRSISLIVDITNYVMLELGQPIHGYDLESISGGLVVRRAQAGESLVTLDHQTRALHPEDLLITDDSGPLGLAGVMGGASSEITASTTSVLIEAATFDPVSIARSARRHKLPSEASKRFERGVDPQVSVAAAARVAELLVRLAGGHPDELGSLWDDTVSVEPILLPDTYVNRLIGADFTDDEVTGALSDIGATVSVATKGFSVVPPTWRPDLNAPEDLAEEVARIVGFDRIPSLLPVAPPGRGLTRSQRLRRSISQALADNGATEVWAFPFVSEHADAVFAAATPEESAARPSVKLANPLDSTAPFLRRSLLPGLLEIAKRNRDRGLGDLRLYETGVVFLPGPTLGSATLPVGAVRPSDEVLAELNAGIPAQPRHLAGLVLGNTVLRQPHEPARLAGIADALDMVHQVASAAGVRVEVEQSQHQGLHPGRTAALFAVNAEGARVPIGYAGELLPAIARERDLPRVVAVFECDLDALITASDERVVTTPISGFPAATQDLSLIVDQSVAAGDVVTAVRAGAGGLVEDIRLVDDYRGPGVDEGSKSLTLALRFRANDRTLTAAEATEAKMAGAAHATETLGAIFRE